MNILGLSCYYHDAAAALIVDGKVVAAAEEERFSRKKHDSDFPTHSINFCLEYASISAKNLDYVVFYEKPFRKFHRIILTSLYSYPKSYAMFREAMRVWLTKKLWIKQEIAIRLPIDVSKILFSEHHTSHAASCFYPSPFKEAAILTVDGVGEWTTTSYGIGEGNKITLLRQLHFPQSLGLLYSAYTAFLGFEVNEGEWKVMGLSPYGNPRYEKEIWKTVRLNNDGSFALDFSYFSFPYSDSKSFSNKLIGLLGDPIPPSSSWKITKKAADIAASIQVVTEKILLHMANHIKKQTNMSNMCMAGGVALNSVANYKILKSCGFENVYIHCAPGDSGGAIGAALYMYHHVLGKKKRSVLESAYLGQQWSNEAIEQSIRISFGNGWRKTGESASWRIPLGVDVGLPRDRTHKKNILYKKYSNKELVEIIATELAKGRVIGWMQGRFEWGPRALGNRSILADPRNPKMKDIINSKVKFREAFRPFAPSVLAEKASAIFDIPENQLSHFPLRFMLYVVPVRSAWQKKVPAITHEDYSARPQLVTRKENPLYYNLISSFYKKTGVPLILNTSFNIKGEPIVSSPADAYSTFMRSGIDVLVMGNFVCRK